MLFANSSRRSGLIECEDLTDSFSKWKLNEDKSYNTIEPSRYVRGVKGRIKSTNTFGYLGVRRQVRLNTIRSRFNQALNSFQEYMFQKFIQQGDLKIIKTSYGESKSSENVSDNPNDKQKSIYSIKAMLERKIEIINISFQRQNERSKY